MSDVSRKVDVIGEQVRRVAPYWRAEATIMGQLEIPEVEAHEEELERRRQEQDAALSKERVEQVFGLTGGELSDEPWKCKPVYEAVSDASPWKFRFWYEGVPDYAASEFPDKWDIEHRTVVTYSSDTPEIFEDEDGRWYKVASWSSSGEAECPGMHMDDPKDELPCKLCEGEDEHGHVYLGDGWCEIVYRQDVVREVLES